MRRSLGAAALVCAGIVVVLAPWTVRNAVALHRYLRWRLPGYDPDRHLGGVLYLYLRGMCGPATPVTDGHPAGVFAWAPPAAFVTAVSDLLAGEVRA